MGYSLLKHIIGVAAILLLLCGLASAQSEGENLPLLTLEECIQRGLDNDPQIVQAQAQITFANNALWGAVANFLPYITTGLGYTWNSRPTLYDTEEVIEADTAYVRQLFTNENYSTSLTISQNIFNGFSDYFNWRASKQSKKSSEMSFKNQILNTIYNLKSSYYNVLRSMKLADIQNKALERSQEQLRITETRYELGSAALSDVLKARVSVGDARLNLISAENNYKIAMARLNQLIGEDINRQFLVDTNVTPREVDYDLENSMDYAMDNNPRLKALEYSYDASRNDVRSAWGGFLPELDFTYRASWNQPDEFVFTDIYRSNRTYFYSLNISLDIFDRFITKRNVSNAKAQHNTDRFNYNNFINELKLMVTESYLNFEKARLSMQVSEDKLASAREDYKLAQEKYSLGAATILDLLDAEVSLKTAESDVIDSEYNFNLAVADLERNMGVREYEY